MILSGFMVSLRFRLKSYRYVLISSSRVITAILNITVKVRGMNFSHIQVMQNPFYPSVVCLYLLVLSPVSPSEPVLFICEKLELFQMLVRV